MEYLIRYYIWCSYQETLFSSITYLYLCNVMNVCSLVISVLDPGPSLRCYRLRSYTLQQNYWQQSWKRYGTIVLHFFRKGEFLWNYEEGSVFGTCFAGFRWMDLGRNRRNPKPKKSIFFYSTCNIQVIRTSCICISGAFAYSQYICILFFKFLRSLSHCFFLTRFRICRDLVCRETN